MGKWTNCEGITRRDCLQLGLGAVTGLGFTDVLRLKAKASHDHKNSTIKPTAKRCILIWMDGGPSHFETLDPKPNAPLELRGDLKPISTTVPGVQFCETLPLLAQNLKKFTVIRSVKHNQGNHGAGNHYMTTGAPPRIPVGCGAFVSFHPSMGSVISKELGKDDGLPGYFSMPSMSRSGGPNLLGAKYAPFVVSNDPNKENFRIRDVALPNGLTGDRFYKRRDLRSQVDKMIRINDKAAADPVSGFDEYYRQGFDLVSSKEAQKAFDISLEPEKIRDNFGKNSFGQRCLLARRLVDAGVPFVTINYGGWDHHDGIYTSLPKKLVVWDKAVNALINDLDERGMLDDTLVIAMGEFGRTPQITTLPDRKSPGRNHWANAMSILMAGGGTPGNCVIGATDRNGHSAVDRILSPENLLSSIYLKMGIDPDMIMFGPQGRPTILVSDPTPIKEIMV
jgi:Protein of unknown function (DUF1501)